MAGDSIFDEPPAGVRKDLDHLSAALDEEIPPKHLDKNLLIATWNIRAFGSLTKKWTASGNDQPKRDLRGLKAIAEIVSRFDVIGIQEVTGDLAALRHLLKTLGRGWAFLMSDVTIGSAGHAERMAFLYDTRRVEPSGLAGELVVPPEWADDLGEDALKRQFARTPYAVSFRSSNTTFILVTLHVDYGSDASDRIPELKGIARWMADWAGRMNRWHHDLIALGDFNIDRKGDPLWEAFTSTGLHVPEQLNEVRRSIFADADEPEKEKFYDQIAWFETGGRRRLTMTCKNAGYFDFMPHVYTDQDLNKNSISFRLSDHYPLWVEFTL